MDLYPNPTAPLILLYPNSPVGENRSRQNPTCVVSSFKHGAPQNHSSPSPAHTVNFLGGRCDVVASCSAAAVPSTLTASLSGTGGLWWMWEPGGGSV